MFTSQSWDLYKLYWHRKVSLWISLFFQDKSARIEEHASQQVLIYACQLHQMLPLVFHCLLNTMFQVFLREKSFKEYHLHREWGNNHFHYHYYQTIHTQELSIRSIFPDIFAPPSNRTRGFFGFLNLFCKYRISLFINRPMPLCIKLSVTPTLDACDRWEVPKASFI